MTWEAQAEGSWLSGQRGLLSDTLFLKNTNKYLKQQQQRHEL
jgi:hypothetical protein